jgi:hypothetical protein
MTTGGLCAAEKTRKNIVCVKFVYVQAGAVCAVVVERLVEPAAQCRALLGAELFNLLSAASACGLEAYERVAEPAEPWYTTQQWSTRRASARFVLHTTLVFGKVL